MSAGQLAADAAGTLAILAGALGVTMLAVRARKRGKRIASHWDSVKDALPGDAGEFSKPGSQHREERPR